MCDDRVPVHRQAREACEGLFRHPSIRMACLQEMGACQFTAFYLTAGIASSLVTYLGRLGRPTGGRSLGASGAVIACFAIAALQHPGALYILATRWMCDDAQGRRARLGFARSACNVEVHACGVQMRRALSSSCRACPSDWRTCCTCWSARTCWASPCLGAGLIIGDIWVARALGPRTTAMDSRSGTGCGERAPSWSCSYPSGEGTCRPCCGDLATVYVISMPGHLVGHVLCAALSLVSCVQLSASTAAFAQKVCQWQAAWLSPVQLVRVLAALLGGLPTVLVLNPSLAASCCKVSMHPWTVKQLSTCPLLKSSQIPTSDLEPSCHSFAHPCKHGEIFLTYMYFQQASGCSPAMSPTRGAR